MKPPLEFTDGVAAHTTVARLLGVPYDDVRQYLVEECMGGYRCCDEHVALMREAIADDEQIAYWPNEDFAMFVLSFYSNGSRSVAVETRDCPATVLVRG